MDLVLWSCILGIPFYFLWNWLAPIYAYWLPAVYQHLPFWHCLGIFALVSIVRFVLFPGGTIDQKWHHRRHS